MFLGRHTPKCCERVCLITGAAVSAFFELCGVNAVISVDVRHDVACQICFD
jgi:hypothetical protein